jgi:hypothetical protein
MADPVPAALVEALQQRARRRRRGSNGRSCQLSKGRSKGLPVQSTRPGING